jgi:PAS domain-containing protein
MNLDWFTSLPVAIAICDDQGVILDMNDKAAATFAKDGGRDLIGKSLLDCHSESSRKQIRQMLRTHTSNCYTIEKSGIKKMIYQTPWFQNSKFSGLIEFSFEIPNLMPHFVRD